jgi:hypothetical protein
MASHGMKGIVAALVAGSLMFGSTAAGASTVATVQQPSPWAVLTAMSGGAPAAAMCGSAATTAAAQGPGGCVLPVVDAAPVPVAQAAPTLVAPPPPPPAGFNPLFLGLLAIAAGVGAYFLLHNNGHGNSPA